MTLRRLGAFCVALLGLAAAGTAGVQVTRTYVREEFIVRVPVRPKKMPHMEWTEHKGPKCIPTAELRGAALAGPEEVDFLLHDRTRMRAEFFGDCRALDFYGRLYLKPDDDRLCAKRDSIYSRMGGSCRIQRFKRLSPKPPAALPKPGD